MQTPLITFSLMSSANSFDCAHTTSIKEPHDLGENLVGSWRLPRTDSEPAGKEAFKFLVDDGLLKFYVQGKEAKLNQYTPLDNLAFTFEYTLDNEEPNFVAGHFTSSNFEQLVLVQELPTTLSESLSVVRLEKSLN